jgi:TRAP-type C4-dicarboxylate transport system permease small subunit
MFISRSEEKTAWGEGKCARRRCSRMRTSNARRAGLRNVQYFLKGVTFIGYVSLSAIVLLTTVNVFGRYILKKPLLGEYDMVELGMAIFGGIAMMVAALQRHHVSVDVLLVRFSRRTRLILGSTASFLGFLTWGLLAHRAFLNGLDDLENGSHSATLRIPQGPIEIVLSILIFLCCLTYLMQVFSPEESEQKGEGGPGT